MSGMASSRPQNGSRVRTVVAFQGEPGAFGELAALRFFPEGARTLSCLDFRSVFAAVRQGSVSAGIVPVENSIVGSIPQNEDLLLRSRLHIVGEIKVRIRLCLMGLPGARLSGVRTVLSQAEALGQCGTFLSRSGFASVRPVHDTAGSARLVWESGDPSIAAVAGRRAATVYGLKVLRRDIEDHRENFTRFVVIGREPDRPRGRAKTSLAAVLRHRPGSLQRFLASFADQGIDLLAIASRPRPRRPWEYVFHIDIGGSAQEPRVSAALNAARLRSIFLRILGSYRPGRTITS